MKKSFKIAIVMTALLLVVLMGVGCASVSKDYAPPRDEAPGEWDTGNEWGGVEDDFQDIAPDSPQTAPLPADKVERKFIQNGSLALRSSDIDKTYESLASLTLSLGGRVISYDQEASGDIKWINMKVAVPFGKLDIFMDHTAENVTKVESKSVTSEEVTEAYYDTQTRIRSTEDLISHYRTMLAKADTVEETLMVQSRIDELTLELESHKGRLQLLDNLTRESRIDITIRMEKDPTITKPEVTWKTMKWSDVGYLMKNAVQRVGIGIVLGLQYFLVFLVYLAPLLILLAIVLLIIWLVRRRKRKRAKMAQARETLPPDPGQG